MGRVSQDGLLHPPGMTVNGDLLTMKTLFVGPIDLHIFLQFLFWGGLGRAGHQGVPAQNCAQENTSFSVFRGIQLQVQGPRKGSFGAGYIKSNSLGLADPEKLELIKDRRGEGPQAGTCTVF